MMWIGIGAVGFALAFVAVLRIRRAGRTMDALLDIDEERDDGGDEVRRSA